MAVTVFVAIVSVCVCVDLLIKIHFGFALVVDWGQSLVHNFNFLTCIVRYDPARHLQDIPCTPMSSTGFVLRISPFLEMTHENTFCNYLLFIYLQHLFASISTDCWWHCRQWQCGDATMHSSMVINIHFHLMAFLYLRSPHMPFIKINNAMGQHLPQCIQVHAVLDWGRMCHRQVDICQRQTLAPRRERMRRDSSDAAPAMTKWTIWSHRCHDFLRLPSAQNQWETYRQIVKIHSTF